MDRETPNGGLSVGEITVALLACRENARQLISESDILVAAGHLARGFTLVYSACEELAKFFIFEITAKRVAQGNPPNWKRFWQRLRSHDSKMAQAEVRLRHILLSAVDDADGEEVSLELDVLFGFGLVPRNSSLYVERGPDGTFRQPSHVDWNIPLGILNATALRLLRAADQFGPRASDIDDALRRPSSDQNRENAKAGLVIALERLRSAEVF